MKKLLSFTLVALLSIAALACASGAGVPAQLSETVTEACTFYQKVKPLVLEYREWATQNWNAEITLPDGQRVPVIPADQKELLRELDSYLPKLDTAGQQICLVAEASDLRRAAKSAAVDWDRVLSVTLKVATTAAQLKAEGVI